MSTESHPAGERIAKVIARSGRASRREAEALIAAGRVAVNGKVLKAKSNILILFKDGVLMLLMRLQHHHQLHHHLKPCLKQITRRQTICLSN